MMTLLDQFFPWLGDLLELGGPILGVILTIAFVMWCLLFERLHYFLHDFPRELARATTVGTSPERSTLHHPAGIACPLSTISFAVECE